MILIFIKNLKLILKVFSVWLWLFVFFILIIFFFIFFQVEIVFYFFPDLILLNLNELFENDINLSFSNKFNQLKGYVFVDPHFSHKSSLLSSSFGIVKYKKYTRHLQIIRTTYLKKARKKFAERIPLNHESKRYKYKRPLFMRYLYHLNSRTIFIQLSLARDLFNLSSFYQKLWLIFWEFSELSNINIQKRKFYSKMVSVRNSIHSFPIRFRRIMNVKVLMNPLYQHLNNIKNYNILNVYKKFSKQIYINFFLSNIEPFRFYNIYKIKRKGPATVRSEFFYTEAGDKDDYFKRMRDDFFSTDLPRDYERFEPKGFGKKKKFFIQQINNNRRYRFRFSKFYNEKYILSSKSNVSRKLKIIIEDSFWRFHEVNENNYSYSYRNFELKARAALDLRSRANFWYRVFSRYGYRKKDYNFKNYDYNFFFKKYYLQFFNDLFIFPSFFKKVNIFDFILFNYYKLNNFFMVYFTKKKYFFEYNNLVKRINFINSNFDLNFKKNIFNSFNFNSSFFFNFFYMIFFFFYKFFKLIINFIFFLISFFILQIKNMFTNFFYSKNLLNYYKIIIQKPKNITINFLYKKFFFYKKLLQDYFKYPKITAGFLKYVKGPYREEVLSKIRYAEKLTSIKKLIKKLTLKKYRKKITRRIFYLKKKFNFFYSNNYYILNKKLINFKSINKFYLIRKIFNFNVNRLIFFKWIFVIIIMYSYYIILFKFWKVLNGDSDIYTWEHLIFIFFFFFITINIVSNPHIFTFI